MLHCLVGEYVILNCSLNCPISQLAHPGPPQISIYLYFYAREMVIHKESVIQIRNCGTSQDARNQLIIQLSFFTIFLKYFLTGSLQDIL